MKDSSLYNPTKGPRKGFSIALTALFIQVFTASAAPTKDTVTDNDVITAVESGLLFDSSVRSDNIDVKNDGGIVTLSGTAPNLISKERATMIAESIKGVRAVVNRIEVTPVSRSDSEIRSDVENALLADSATDLYEIKTMVADGVVTLSGEVDSWQEKELSAGVAKGVKGVKELKNEIAVVYKTERPDSEIAEDVKAALKRDVWVSDLLINAEVSNGTVTLSGTVGSAAEKGRAFAAAYVAGVKAVNDEGLKVDPWFKDSMKKPTKSVLKTDPEIERAVKDALLFDPRVVSFNPTVTVSNGAVTLTGTVDNLKAKRAAEQDAENTVGVSRVVNLLKVRGETRPPDDKIVQNVKDSLFRDPYVDQYEIAVTARDGLVYLNGIVDTHYEKTHAEDVASRVNGVTGINNNLTVTFPRYSYYYWPYSRYYYEPYTYNRSEVASATERRDDSQIKEDIGMQMFWSPFVDAEEVKVSVTDGVATLNGTVDSWSEYNAAVENAYEGGAKRVITKLDVK